MKKIAIAGLCAGFLLWPLSGLAHPANAAAPSVPNPFHIPICCEQPQRAGLAADGAVDISPVLYLRPSLNLQVVVRDGLTRQWTVGLTPGVGYGIAWDPYGLQLMRKRNPSMPIPRELLGLDAHVSAGISEGVLRGRILLMLTVGGLVTVGAGLDAALGSGQVPDRYGLAVAVLATYAL